MDGDSLDLDLTEREGEVLLRCKKDQRQAQAVQKRGSERTLCSRARRTRLLENLLNSSRRALRFASAEGFFFSFSSVARLDSVDQRNELA